MNGLFVLDKPAGLSSADALNRCKRAFPKIKLGHAGTLDPMATGILVVLLGEATKLQAYLMDGRKSYVAEIELGATTDTLDADGTITEERDATAVTLAALREVAPRFVGTIDQVPPAYSALHVEGERSYDLARAGKAVALPPRPVQIHAITVDSFTPGPRPRAIVTIDCGKGTYIRSLARDLAAAVGTVGHLTALRRTRLGRFTLAEAVGPAEVGPERVLTDLLLALPDVPCIELTPDAETWVRHGKSENVRTRIPIPPNTAESAVVRLARDGRLVALAEPTASGLVLRRVFS